MIPGQDGRMELPYLSIPSQGYDKFHSKIHHQVHEHIGATLYVCLFNDMFHKFKYSNVPLCMSYFKAVLIIKT